MSTLRYHQPIDPGDAWKFVKRTERREWDRLLTAMDQALNGSWSIEAENVLDHLVRAIRLRGQAVKWQTIPYPLVRNGVYEAVLRKAGVLMTLPDVAQIKETDALFKQDRHRLFGHTSPDLWARRREAVTAAWLG